MSTLVGLLIINLTYFIFHFGLKRELKFKSALDILNTLHEAQKINKRAGLCGWIDEFDYERERKVYGLKFTKLTSRGIQITEFKI